MAAVAQKLIIAACQQAASGWKMKIGRKVRLTCGPHINEKYAKGERATGVWSMENKKRKTWKAEAGIPFYHLTVNAFYYVAH